MMITSSPKKPVTPKQFLENHELYKKLKRLGITNKQLYGISFKYKASEPFELWSMQFQNAWKPKQLAYAKPWCTLRWLIMDNPESSLDRDRAWDYLANYLGSTRIAAGEKHLASAKKRYTVKTSAIAA